MQIALLTAPNYNNSDGVVMTHVKAFSLDSLQPEPQPDVQLKLLNNALARFCDLLEEDSITNDAERNIVTRHVTWRYGSLRFKAKLITFDQEASIGQYDVEVDGDWQRLTTPRALAEKLAQARKLNEIIN